MEKVLENLRKNGFLVTEFATKEEAAEYLLSGIHGKTVGMGGSVTLGAMDVYDRLCADNTVYWHQVTPGDDVCQAETTAQVFITSANAISEEGYLLNIDGRGNRVASTLMKKERVIFVVGENKLSGPFPQALERARNIAAPKNTQRLHKQTPCAANGDKCYDCSSPDRICNALVVMWKRPWWCEKMEVVLVHEVLGY